MFTWHRSQGETCTSSNFCSALDDQMALDSINSNTCMTVEHQLEIIHCPKFLQFMNFSWSATASLLSEFPPAFCQCYLPTTAVVYTYIPFPLNQALGIFSPSMLLCGMSSFWDKYVANQNGALILPLTNRGSNWKIFCVFLKQGSFHPSLSHL